MATVVDALEAGGWCEGAKMRAGKRGQKGRFAPKFLRGRLNAGRDVGFEIVKGKKYGKTNRAKREENNMAAMNEIMTYLGALVCLGFFWAANIP